MSAACPSLSGSPSEPCVPPVPVAAPRPAHGPAHHPRGLHRLCVVVFFERWAACLLASSTVLMLCERYGFGWADALRWVGVFNASTYVLTLAGGFVIDRMLSSQRALAGGLALLALGYAAMVLPGARALQGAVTLLLLGHALFKPSTQTVMAGLYAQDDPRLDAAQIRFYLAINAGGTVGALTAGLLARGHNFRVLCATAAAAMVCGRVALCLGRPTLRTPAHAPRPAQPTSASTAAAAASPSPLRWGRVVAALLLAMMLYTLAFGQVEGSLFLWAQERTDRRILGFEVPAAWFVGLPALLVLLLAPVQLWLLPRLTQRIRTEQLIAAGVLALFAAFAVLLPPAVLLDARRVSMAWLCASMTLIVVGELLIAPLSLSLLLRLVPARWVSLLVALWYVAGAAGYWLSGEIGAYFVSGVLR